MNKMEESKIKKSGSHKKIKKLFVWGGWKKELFWILFICAILFAGWSYKRDMKICEYYINHPCEACTEEIKVTEQLNSNRQVNHFGELLIPENATPPD